MSLFAEEILLFRNQLQKPEHCVNLCSHDCGHDTIYASVNSSCAYPPRQLRGICAPCRSQGWGISKFGVARGLGICLPRGYPWAFDTHVVPNMEDFIGKDQQFVADLLVCHDLSYRNDQRESTYVCFRDQGFIIKI